MARVLTENQMLLTEYLAAIGNSPTVVFEIVTTLWDGNAVLEMLQFCKDNPKANSAQLLKASSKIAKKYNLKD